MAKNLRPDRPGTWIKSNTTAVLKKHSHEMTANDIVPHPDKCLAQPLSEMRPPNEEQIQRPQLDSVPCE